MQQQFDTISEPGLPGLKWQAIFNTFWPDYQAWLARKGTSDAPDLGASLVALKQYMPEMLPTWERLCALANADEAAARLLTGFRPPAYLGACSQAVMNRGSIQLVRNYDYHPDIMEGKLLLSAWNGKKVIASSDSLAGALDGINEDGLVVSLTFGGRKEVGYGFGIPFILRYVLEFCSNVQEAVAALLRIPSHMSYNVTVLDKSGDYKTVYLAPDKAPYTSNLAYTTNHQEFISWPENAQFNKTVERADFLADTLAMSNLQPESLLASFLNPPLYKTDFEAGFGTLYTAVYYPVERSVRLLWPNQELSQSFDNFTEQTILIHY